MSIEERLLRLEEIISVVQTNVCSNEQTINHKKVAKSISELGLKGTSIFKVPDNYYNLSLEERALILNTYPDCLTKTLFYENVSGTVINDLSAPLSLQKYIGVVVQYKAKLSLDKVEKFIGNNAKLVFGDITETGFLYNGLAPWGGDIRFPLIIAKAIEKVPEPRHIWLGGGEVNLKFRVFLKTLEGVSYPIHFLHCTDPRDDYDDE